MTQLEFQMICQRACRRLQPSSSLALDQEALFYGIYWQVCERFERPIYFAESDESKLYTFQKQLQSIIDLNADTPFNAIKIARRCINETIVDVYQLI